MVSIAPKMRLVIPSTPTTARLTTTAIPPRMRLKCIKTATQQHGPVSTCQPYQPTFRASQPIRAFSGTSRQNEREPLKNSPRGLLPEFSLKDKVIIVSGGARGLGLVQAEALLEAGATVHVFDRLPPPKPEDKDEDFNRVAKRAKEELDTTLTYHQIDVRADVDALNPITEEIANKYGRLDGLVAAAGIQQETPALEYTAADSDKMLAVNVTGVLLTAQAVARQMVRLKQPGSIVMIASMSGTVANRGLICPVYNASKAGVIQLGRNLASEWGEYGIRVNTISPGYILTKMVEELFERFPERRTEWPKQNMLGRVSDPHEYRGAAVFLLSDASSFMTGSDLRMDGGHAAW